MLTNSEEHRRVFPEYEQSIHIDYEILSFLRVQFNQNDSLCQ